MLKRSGRYTLVGLPSELTLRLDEIHLEDKRAEANASAFQKFGCVGILAGFGTLATGLDVGGVPLAVPAVGASVLTMWLGSSYWSERNLDDNKVEACRRLLETLQVDLRPDVQVELSVDFREAAGDARFVTKRQGGWLSSVKTRYFSQTWLKLGATLADRTQLELEVTRRGRRKDKSKRKRTKVSVVARDIITVTLRLDPDRYPGIARLPQVLGTPPQGLLRGGCRVQGARVSAGARSPGTRGIGYNGPPGLPAAGLADAQQLLGCLAWVWRGLKALKTEEMKKTPA